MSTKKSVNKVVLAYSGGLDTSCIVPWLIENYGCEVVCFCANLGQDEELSGLEAKALACGASKLYIEDLREEFITDYIYPTMMAGAIYEREYLLGTSFARPLIAKRMVEIAELEGADAVATAHRQGQRSGALRADRHGAQPEAEDHRALARVAHPQPRGRAEIRCRAQCPGHGHHQVDLQPGSQPLAPEPRGRHPGRSVAGAGRGDVQLSVSPEAAPDVAEYVEIDFEQGVPKRVNGVAMGPIDLVATLNTIGARHGVGRIDLVENRLVGMKSHGVYETPGGTILYRAHEGLEQICLDKQTLHYKQMIALKYAELVYNGQWFTPLREALDAFVAVTQGNVTGTSG